MTSLFKRISFLCLFLSSIGFSLQHFQLPWMNAQGEGVISYNSQEYQDAVWVIETYFLGCPYCNDNAPKVNSLQNYFKNDERVQILDVGIDKKDSDYAEWIRRHNPNHPVLKDSARLLAKQLGTSVYPSTYVLDKNLNVVFKSSGDWSSKVETQIKDAVEKALER
ncbi:MAG: TlpA family protein disulfide reductase [Proteobacteria bacterium]|nr:TlpA family protein disulfide reductase [Pseudomonadota bacterium]